jgi:hypothetical protein
LGFAECDGVADSDGAELEVFRLGLGELSALITGVAEGMADAEAFAGNPNNIKYQLNRD